MSNEPTIILGSSDEGFTNGLTAAQRFRLRHPKRAAEANRRYAERHPERVRESQKSYYARNREAQKEKNRRYRETNRERIRLNTLRYRERHPTSQRDRDLRTKYGITVGQYEDMLLFQGQRCAICHTVRSARLLHVDHDHDTGQVRGLLCVRCNTFLGYIETMGLLAEAMGYLRKGGVWNQR